MADLLIRGMTLPSGCLSCDFCNPFADEPYCRRLMKRCPNVTRLEECPLVELPDHGDLIDRAELLKKCPEWGYSPRQIKEAETIVPASKEGGE